MHQRMVTALLSLALILSAPMTALGVAVVAPQNLQVNEAKIELNGGVVRYPQLSGMADEAIQQKINDDIVLSGDVTGHILTLSTLGQSSWGLEVSYLSYVDEHVFSMVLMAKGKQPGGQNGQSNVALTYDLSTGEPVTLAAVFKDVSAAVAWMEQAAQESLEFSEYFENAAITPLPVTSFMLDDAGITFYYPSEQFSYLSGYGGGVQFFYDEIADFLVPESDGLPAQMGMMPQSLSAAQQKESITAAVTAGKLPQLPVELDEPMPDIVQRYRLVREPDAFPGGRYFELEAPVFRSILLISDSMTDGYDHSVLRGVQLRRGTLYGLTIGQSVRADWQSVLGQPEETIVFTESMAYDYSLPMGQSDIYHFGGNELRLHSDVNGTLSCIQLSK